MTERPRLKPRGLEAINNMPSTLHMAKNEVSTIVAVVLTW